MKKGHNEKSQGDDDSYISDQASAGCKCVLSTECEGSAANVLVLDITGHHQTSCVHALTSQSFFESTRRAYTIR